MRADKAVFDRVASGEQNGMAAFLRGAIEVEGDQALLLPFQRLFRPAQGHAMRRRVRRLRQDVRVLPVPPSAETSIWRRRLFAFAGRHVWIQGVAQ